MKNDQHLDTGKCTSENEILMFNCHSHSPQILFYSFHDFETINNFVAFYDRNIHHALQTNFHTKFIWILFQMFYLTEHDLALGWVWDNLKTLWNFRNREIDWSNTFILKVLKCEKRNYAKCLFFTSQETDVQQFNIAC